MIWRLNFYVGESMSCLSFPQAIPARSLEFLCWPVSCISFPRAIPANPRTSKYGCNCRASCFPMRYRISLGFLCWLVLCISFSMWYRISLGLLCWPVLCISFSMWYRISLGLLCWPVLCISFPHVIPAKPWISRLSRIFNRKVSPYKANFKS